MITYVKGDAIQAYKNKEVDVLIHCANCFNTMGSGFAKALKEEYPQVYEADCKTKKGDVLKLGTFSVWEEHSEYSKEGFRAIYNLYGQYNYGKGGAGHRYVEYAAIINGIDKIFHSLPYYTIKVGMPKIGCGLAGGDWSLIEKIIKNALELEKVFDKDKIEIFVYEL